MKHIYLPFTIFFLSLNFFCLAQNCPPPGFPESGNTCLQAPILCENLDGYCNTINNNNVQQNFPGCNNNVLNNDEWFGFYAGSTTIEIQVVPSNCNPGPFMGLQAGIYDNCISGIMDVQCPCSTQPFTLFSTQFVIGEVYYFVIDGCGGNVCDYEINVLQGSTVGEAPANPGPITGPDTVCVSDVDVYAIPPAYAATIYDWTITPALGTINNPNNDQTTGVNWGNAPGTAEICVEVSNLCYANPTPSCQTVVILPLPTATLAGSGDLCAEGTETIDLTITFTGSPVWQFVYTFNGVAQPPITTSTNPYILTIDEPGTYALQSVTTIGANCVGTVSGSTTIANVVVTPSASVVNATCSQSNGSINLSVSGGVVPYTFNWSNGGSTEDLDNIPPGNYSVTVLDANGCTGELNVNVGDDNNEPTVTSTTTPSICGLPNGDINISVTGGDPPYTYLWSNGDTTEDLDDVNAGSYTVTVTGADGCTQTHTVTLANDDPPISITPTIVANTTCPPVTGNGSISITISPATAPGGGSYTIDWSTGDTGTSVTNLPPGSYSVTVSTGNSCSNVGTFTVPDQPNPPTVTSTTTPSECALANGDINLSVSGGVPPYTYLWSNGETTEDLDNVLAGSYSVTVTGANGCTQTGNVNLTNNNPPITITPTIQANTTCPPITPNGSISIGISPANAPGLGSYTINWSTGDTGTSLTDLPPGSYSVTVSAGGDCSQTASFTVPDQPNTPNVTVNTTPSECALDNGDINISVSGGVPPYTYLWSNSETTEDLSDVLSGSYSVTVTGANGCATVTSVNLTNNNPPITITPVVQPSNSCPPVAPNGSISITISPANAPGSGTYTINWSTGDTGTSLTNLSPGTYTVTVSAGGACSQVNNITVPNAPNPPVLSTTVSPASCGLDNGGTTVFVSGGVGPMTYLWSNGSTNSTLSNVPGGSYSVTVTGANGCTAVTTATIPDNQVPISISENITPNTACPPSAYNGAISISVTPANATITWSNGSNQPTQSNLMPGSYSVTVSAGGTCTQVANFTVPDNAEVPSLSAVPTPSECNQANGAVTLSIIGGLPPLTIQWSNGAQTQNLNNVLAGTYSVTVSSPTGCVGLASVTVPNNDLFFTLDGFATGNSSCGFPNGSVLLSVNPPNGNYTYQWNNGETTPILSNVPAGTYEVTVSAGGTCTQVTSFQVFEFAFPPNLSTSATAATCGLSNGSVNLTVDGNSPPFTFNWSNGANTEDLANVPPGNYAVTVTDANFCTATANVAVGSNNVAINLSATPAANTSCLTANGAINLTATPAGNYTYTWSNGANTEDLTGLAAGTYTVTVTLGTSCSSTASYTVANNTSQPQITEDVTPAVCNQPDGAIDLSVSGATPPYNFLWSNNETSEDLTGLLPGDYTVTVSGVNGCSSTATINVPNNSSTFTIAGTPSPVNTCAFANGTVNLTITPAGTYDILWSNGETVEDLDSLSAGTYTVTVTESGSCSASASFTITDQTSFPALSQSVTAELCGQQDGSIDLTVTGNSTPYTFLWSNGETSEDLTGVAEGTYSVTVTGANDCTATSTMTVPGNTIAFDVNGTPAANTACGTNNGAIDLTVSPAGSYTFLWSNTQTTEDLTSLAGGSYSVTVSAGGNCTSVANFTVPSTTADPAMTPAVTPSTCGESNGSINLTVTAGVGPYSFLWSNGGTTEDLGNILAGSYSVTVTGSNGCAANANFTVPDNAIVLTVNGTPAANTSCDMANGSIDLSVSPAGTYEFLWSTNATTEDLTDLPPGTYSVTVTEGPNCTAEATFTVSNATNAPDILQTIDPATCGQSDGGIDLTLTGGTTPYAIGWSNGETTEDLSGVPPGTYAVTVTGADGCSNTGSFTVPDQPVAIDILAQPSANSSCDLANGTIDLSVSPAGSYTYGWSNGETTEDLTGLPSGNYTVTVSLGLTCSATASVTVDNDTNAPDISQTISAANCGLPDGSIDLSLTGGTQPYAIGWSNGETTEDLTGILPGSYSVTVTGDDGCSNTASFTVPNDTVTIQISGTETANTACGTGNGTIDLQILPPGTYDITWTGGQTSEDLSDLPAGSYSVTVSAGGTCTATASFTVADEPAVPAISHTITASICSQPDGGIDLTVTGGTTPYQFDWSNGETTEDLTGILSGGYDVTVTAANGCTATASLTVPNNSNTFSLAGTSSPNTLCGASDGSINLTVTPIGAGTGPYGFEWSNGETTEDLTGLQPGTYTVTVSDGGSCTGTASFTVGSNAPTVVVSGTATDILCFGEMTGAIDLTITGGVMPYQIDWSPSIPGSPQGPVNLAAGPYAVTVTDASGCSGTASFVLAQPNSEVQVSCSQTTTVSAPGNSDGAAGVNINGGTGPYTVTWSPGSTQTGLAEGIFAIDNLAEGLYSVSVVDANGCETTCNFTMTSTACEVEVSVTANPTEILDCTVEAITLIGSATGATTATYAWFQNGQPYGNSQSIVVNEGGVYTLIVTDATTGCTDEATVEISDNTDFPPLFLDPAEELNCNQPQVTISGGSLVVGVTFSWATIVGTDTTLIGSGTSTVVSQPGTYWLIGVASNGCVNAIQLTVSGDFSTPTAAAGASFIIGCNGGGVSNLDGTGSTGSGSLQFLWETLDGLFAAGQNTATPGVLEPGTYTLTVTQASNGCTDTDEVTVGSDGPQLVPMVENPDCYGEPGTLILQDVQGGTPPYQYSIDGGQNFAAQNVFFNLPPGQYDLVVLDENGCDDAETAVITQPDSLYVLVAEPQVSVKLGDSYQLGVEISLPQSEIETVTWTPPTYLDCADCFNPVSTPEATIQYLVTVRDSNGCEDTAPVLLLVDRRVQVYVPNVFSPNGDGVNDVFMIFADPKQVREVKSFLVFSRWGESVFAYTNFEPNNPAYGWDGHHRGEPLNPAVFAWFAEVEFTDGRVELFEGDVTLVK